MPNTRALRWRIAAGLLVVIVIAVAVLLWRDPYTIIRGEFARQRIAAGLRIGHVQAAGHQWTYAHRDADTADSPVIVMIHGFTGGKENWYPLARRLRGQYRLVIPDLPGWGDSQRKPDADYGYLEQADRVADFIATVSPDRQVVLLGHSMGGGIAALVAARYPDRVVRVGLLDAAGVRFRDNRFGEQVLAGQNPFGVHDAASLDTYLETVFHQADARPWLPWPASSIYINRRRDDAAFEQRVLDGIGRGEFAFSPGAAARHIRQPTLLLWCAQDAVIDPSAMGLYAERIPQAMQVLLEGCGHMSLVEQPDAVASAVQMLIERGQPR